MNLLNEIKPNASLQHNMQSYKITQFKLTNDFLLHVKPKNIVEMKEHHLHHFSSYPLCHIPIATGKLKMLRTFTNTKFFLYSRKKIKVDGFFSNFFWQIFHGFTGKE